MTKISELSGDLVEEILCRVPVISVKTVRSTCKGWDRLFKEKRFERKHSVKAAKQLMCLMLSKRFRICPMSVNFPSVEVKGELSLVDPRSALQFDVSQVFHCDGLLLCASEAQSRFVVWNPFTGQTRWIDSVNPGSKGRRFALGYHQDNRSYTRSYKVLSFRNHIVGRDSEEIYDFDSDSWRSLEEGGGSEPRGAGRCNDQMVSFKGNTYWFALEKEKEKRELGVFLLSFDFSTDKFGRVPLPYKCRYETACFSVVREEKLAVLLEPVSGSKTEIWVTSKIGGSETKWTKVLALELSLDLQISDYASFLLDEEKKVVVCCDRWIDDNDETCTKDMVYIIGEDSNVTQAEFGVDKIDGCWPVILNYFPCSVQIERPGGKKRKRVDMMELIGGKRIPEAITFIKDRLKTLDNDVRAIGGLAESIPFGLSLLEDAKSDLESLLDAQLRISNRRALLERYM